MLSPLDIIFWQTALPAICMLTLPIALVSGAPIWRSFLASAVVYLLITLLSACNIPPPF